MNIYPLRLIPNMDLKEELEKVIEEQRWSSCWVMTGIGSLSRLSLRFAGQDEIHTRSGVWEVCSIGGTLSMNGSHLHMVVSDERGKTLGGHVGYGNIIRTTCEIVLGYDSSHRFTREYDAKTGYSELVIHECFE